MDVTWAVREHYRWRAVAAVCLGYFLLLGIVVAVTLAFDLPLASGEGFFRFPTTWALVIAAVYYLLPIALALLVPAQVPVFRRYLRGAAAIAGSIFLLHGLYSVVVTLERDRLAEAWLEARLRSEQAQPRFVALAHDLRDDNGDGLVDRVEVRANLQPEELDFGDYHVLAYFSHPGPPLYSTALGSRDFELTQRPAPPQSFNFETAAESLRELAVRGPLSLTLELYQRIRLDARHDRAIALCGWAAFFCPSRHGGGDPVLYDDVVPLGRFADLYQIELPPEQIQRDPLLFRRYLDEAPHDLDGDGLYETLEVRLELDSLYEGPLYAQITLDDGETASLLSESRVARGVGEASFALPGEWLRAGGRDGPYRLSQFIVLNNSPHCPSLPCSFPNQPMITLYLPRYETRAYEAAQFE
jgi:hypothetical protein